MWKKWGIKVNKKSMCYSFVFFFRGIDVKNSEENDGVRKLCEEKMNGMFIDIILKFEYFYRKVLKIFLRRNDVFFCDYKKVII